MMSVLRKWYYRGSRDSQRTTGLVRSKCVASQRWQACLARINSAVPPHSCSSAFALFFSKSSRLPLVLPWPVPPRLFLLCPVHYLSTHSIHRPCLCGTGQQVQQQLPCFCQIFFPEAFSEHRKLMIFCSLFSPSFQME